MKIKKLIKLLECIEGDYEGNLPQDMYDLGSYTRANDSRMGIDDMDFVHVMRAFKKMQGILAEDYDVGLQVSVSQTNQITKLEKKVSELLEENEQYKKHCNNSVSIDVYENLKERNAYLKERVEELIPVKAYPKYDFCEVPNDCDGQRFIDDIKKYLNTNKYKMRVRGQHIKEEYKGTGATAYGQNIEQSTHLRVYIEEK